MKHPTKEKNVADQEKQNDEVEIVIEDDVVVEEKGFDVEGLSDDEVALAKEHGLVPEEKKEDDGDDGKEEKEENEEEDEETNDDPKSFEEMDGIFDKDENKFHKTFTPNAKALYFQNKKNKNLRQDLQREVEELKTSKDLGALKVKVNQEKLEKISAMLDDTENLTIEKIQSVLGGNVKDSDGTSMMSKEDFEREKAESDARQQKDQERLAQRINLASSIGKSKYDNFDDILNLTQEVVNGDASGFYKKTFVDLVNSSTVDEDQIVDMALTIARLSPKFKDTMNKATPEDKEKVGRVIKNSKKKVSSASVSGSGKRVITNEDDLTVDDAIKMKDSEFHKLSKKTQERLLGKK